MERRTFLAGAAGLMVADADKVLAQPKTKTTTTTLTQPEEAEPQMTEVTVAGVLALAEPELSDSLVVVLKAREGEQFLSMWIGRPEGTSIYEHLARALETPQTQRPKTFRPSSHDFMAALVKSLGGEVESVSITLEKEVFYATTTVVGSGKSTKVDGRPSDSIALALRFEAPLFVASDLLKPSSWPQVRAQINEQSAQTVKDLKAQAQIPTPPK